MGVHRKVNGVKYGDGEGFLLNSSQGEFEQMCLQEILGLTDKADVQQFFHDDFKDLKNVSDGTYSTRLSWKSDHPPLP